MDLIVRLIELVTEFSTRYKIEHVIRHFHFLPCRDLKARRGKDSGTSRVVVRHEPFESLSFYSIADLYRRTLINCRFAYNDLIRILGKSSFNCLQVHPLHRISGISSDVEERLI